MKMRDAQVGDIYISGDKHVWRVMGTCAEPTVILKNIETSEQMRGGVSGLMWNGFKRVHRPGTDTE